MRTIIIAILSTLAACSVAPKCNTAILNENKRIYHATMVEYENRVKQRNLSPKTIRQALKTLLYELEYLRGKDDDTYQQVLSTLRIYNLHALDYVEGPLSASHMQDSMTQIKRAFFKVRKTEIVGGCHAGY